MPLRIALLLMALLISPVSVAADYVRIPAGPFVSALAVDGSASRMHMHAFAMRVEPVTQAEYLAFVTTHDAWQRGRVAPILAGPRYLQAWAGAQTLGVDVAARQPVTQVSWFAARAFCSSEKARLPTWYEWEYVAAADATGRDARADADRNQDLLTAILASSGSRPGLIGQRPANVFGVRDINRLLWEWTDDYAAMFPNADARIPGVEALLALCGGSALAFADKSQYAVMMRVAALTALKPVDAAPRVGFRCVRDLPGE